MRKILLLAISLLTGIGLFIWVLNIIGFEETKQALAAFNIWKLGVIILLTSFIVIIGVWKWKEILKGMGVKISYRSLMSPYLIGYAVMLLAPIIIWGSEILRGYIIKEKNDVPWKKGMASVIIHRMMEWTATLIMIVFGTAIFIAKTYRLLPQMEFFFGAVFLFFAMITLYFYSKVFKKKSFIKTFVRIFGLKRIKENNLFSEIEDEIFTFFNVRNRAMWNAIAATFLRIGIMWGRAWLLIVFIGKNIGALPALSVLGFNLLAALVPIPAALGSNEAIQTFAFNAFGLAPSNAVVFAMIIRISEITISLFGVVALLIFGTHFFKKIFFKKLGKLVEGDIDNNNIKI